MELYSSFELLVCLPNDSAYWFHLHLHYNQLISVHAIEDENRGVVYSRNMYSTLIFIAQKDKCIMVKWKLHRGQKQQHYTARRTPALCKHLHRHHANTKHVIRYGRMVQ